MRIWKSMNTQEEKVSLITLYRYVNCLGIMATSVLYGLVATKPVFRVSDKARLKPVASAPRIS